MRLALAILALIPSIALASDAPPASDLFACTFQNGGKAVKFDIYGDTVRYRFGKPGQTPELVVLRTVREAGMRPWNGVGSSIWDEVSVENQGVTYLANAWADRNAGDDSPVNGTLLVMQGEEQLAELTCDKGSVRGNIYLLYEAKERAGQHWCMDSFTWRNGACDG